MKLFDKLFDSKKENPFFTIFKQTFPKGTDFSQSKVYHIKSFQDTDSNMELFEKKKFDKDFYMILDGLEYNSQTNNIGMYYVINSEGNGTVYLLSDPVELWEKESIIGKYDKILDEHVMSLSTVERIN